VNILPNVNNLGDSHGFGIPVSYYALIFVAKITTFAKFENVRGKFKNQDGL